jgi:uncharacterized paraquat-inducible protein A
VFVYSFALPIAKLALLLWIWFVPVSTVHRGERRARLLAQGKRSMIDVFIVAILGSIIACGCMRKLAAAAEHAQPEPVAAMREPTSAEDARRPGL